MTQANRGLITAIRGALPAAAEPARTPVHCSDCFSRQPGRSDR